MIYLMAGPETPALARAAAAGGADIVEIGFPFSDPLADGPVIRGPPRRRWPRDAHRACLDVLAQHARARADTPLVPMTYASLLEAYGWERFETTPAAAVPTSLIVADLPGGGAP